MLRILSVPSKAAEIVSLVLWGSVVLPLGMILPGRRGGVDDDAADWSENAVVAVAVAAADDDELIVGIAEAEFSRVEGEDGSILIYLREDGKWGEGEQD